MVGQSGFQGRWLTSCWRVILLLIDREVLRSGDNYSMKHLLSEPPPPRLLHQSLIGKYHFATFMASKWSEARILLGRVYYQQKWTSRV